MTKVSIAIPTWEANGRGREFLNDLLSTIEIQTLKDYEVIVCAGAEAGIGGVCCVAQCSGI